MNSFTTIIADLFSVASVFTPEGAAFDGFSLAGNSLNAATDIASAAQSGESVNDGFQTTVANYGSQLVNRLNAAQGAYARMLDLALSDYGKLKTIGTKRLCSVSNPSCTGDWRFIKSDIQSAAQGLDLWARRDSWQTFLPARFGLAVLRGNEFYETRPNAFPSSQSSLFKLANFGCDGPSRPPFETLPASAQWNLSSQTQARDDGYDIWLISNFSAGGAAPVTELPAASITDPLFKPADPGGDPFTGGLGFLPAHLTFRAWDPKHVVDVLGPSGYSEGCSFLAPPP
jgi:hypothetical protein